MRQEAKRRASSFSSCVDFGLPKMSFLKPPKAAQPATEAIPTPPESSALPVELDSVASASAEQKSGLRGMMSSYMDSK